jgi:hypothetical protein
MLCQMPEESKEKKNQRVNYWKIGRLLLFGGHFLQKGSAFTSNDDWLRWFGSISIYLAQFEFLKFSTMASSPLEFVDPCKIAIIGTGWWGQGYHHIYLGTYMSAVVCVL